MKKEMPAISKGLKKEFLSNQLLQNDTKDTVWKMTQLLERAFAAASKLPAQEQDAFASLLLAELDAEQRWTRAFAATEDQLSDLADQALCEFEAGQTQPMNLDRDFSNH